MSESVKIGWRVHALDRRGRRRPVGRLYSSPQAAQRLADLFIRARDRAYRDPIVVEEEALEPEDRAHDRTGRR